MTTWQMLVSTWTWDPSVIVGCIALTGLYLVAVHFRLNRKAVLFITDPLGVVNEEVARIFGFNTEVSFRRVRTGNVTNVSGWGDYTEKKLFPEKSVWGIQLKIKW